MPVKSATAPFPMTSVLASLVAFVLAVVGVLSLAACGSSSDAGRDRAGASAGPSAGSAHASDSAPATDPPSPAAPSTRPVHASLLEFDGVAYGVGMPIIMRFDVAVTDPTELEQAVTVSVNGAPADGAWYWFTPTEAHYRGQAYWPANATISMDAPLHGLSAGPGLSYDDSLTLRMRTGDAHISTVDATTLQMTVTSNGAVVNTLPVSLGKAATPTYSGTKVVMEKDEVEHMVGPGYDEDVPWSLRITNSGEFIHAAPWNSQIGQASTSNGCTNLDTDAAIWMYKFSRIGDVVLYPNAPGPTMPSWDGYGDWNLSWATWEAGGAL